MRVEQLDDLPLLGEQLKSYGLSDLLDTHFPDHGLWQGISGGKLAVVWFLYILSQGDHRLSHVEDWATLRLRTLGSILEEGEMRSIDFCDDRLARLLDRYSNDETWHSFEEALGSRLLQVYRVAAPGSTSSAGFQVVRADSFNAPQFRSEGALFTYGYSKQRRSDQPFCKVMVAAMDLLCLPLAIEVLKGSGPDVDHYLPVIQRVQSILGQCGNLYVGDSQLGSFPNRLQIHHDGDYYLCPLGRKQCSMDKLHHYLDQVPEQVDKLPGLFTQADAKRKSAYFYEITENLEDEDSQLKWTERRLLVYCPEYAEGLIKSFNNRLDEAETAIGNLVISKSGRRNPKTLKDLHAHSPIFVKLNGY
jgi:transposase